MVSCSGRHVRILFCCHRDLLKDLGKLERLNLEHNQLQHIAVQAFTHVPGLKELTLSHNRLSLSGLQTEVGEVQSVLSACVQLEKLSVSNNSVKTVFSDWVLTLLNLHTLDLSHNLISNLTVSNYMILRLCHSNKNSSLQLLSGTVFRGT
jgi:Leucine-rich repeat (LRR) protein